MDPMSCLPASSLMLMLCTHQRFREVSLVVAEENRQAVALLDIGLVLDFFNNL